MDCLPEGKKVIENVVSYDWSIDTKYYTADVHLCLTKERTIGDERFAESVHAFVVYFDAEKVNVQYYNISIFSLSVYCTANRCPLKYTAEPNHLINF